jgi:hypothetical protein
MNKENARLLVATNGRQGERFARRKLAWQPPLSDDIRFYPKKSNWMQIKSDNRGLRQAKSVE